MDCNMPLMDGYTATKILKTNVKEGLLTPMTIIACTAGVTQKDKERCISVQYDDILTKPIMWDHLKLVLEKTFVKEEVDIL